MFGAGPRCQMEKEIVPLREGNNKGNNGNIMVSNTVTIWRGGRVAECGGLENRCPARGPGFESQPLRSLF